MDLGFGESAENKQSPEAKAATLAYNIITKAKGIESWANVSHQIEADGRIHFKGTVYFQDLSKVALDEMDLVIFQVVKDDAGRMIFTAAIDSDQDKKDKNKNSEAKPKVDTATLTAKDVETIIVKRRQEYEFVRSMMAMVLGTVEERIAIHLPGLLTEVHGAKRDDAGTVRFVFKGQKLLETMDGIAASDTILEQQIRAVGNTSDKTSEMKYLSKRRGRRSSSG